MILMDMGDQRLKLIFGAMRGKVGDLWFEAANEIGGGINDVGTKTKDGVIPALEVNRKFGGIGVEANAKQRIILFPCGGEHLGESHAESFNISPRPLAGEGSGERVDLARTAKNYRATGNFADYAG